MKVQARVIVALAAAALAGGVTAQTTAVGRAASAAVTPGDQNMGRDPQNRSGGLMGTDRSATTGTTSGMTSGSTTDSSTRRAARADRG